MDEEKMIKLKIFRFNPLKDEEPRYVTYAVPFEEGMSVLNALNYIYENFDRSLAYYYSCRIGRCDGCSVMVNGVAALACCTLAKDGMTIEPPLTLGFRVIKDLIASDILVNERNKISLPRINAHHRFNKAYAEAKNSTLTD